MCVQTKRKGQITADQHRDLTADTSIYASSKCVCPVAAVMPEHLQVDTMQVTTTKPTVTLTSDLLHTGLYKKRKWENRVERGLLRAFLARSSPPTSLSS